MTAKTSLAANLKVGSCQPPANLQSASDQGVANLPTYFAKFLSSREETKKQLHTPQGYVCKKISSLGVGAAVGKKAGRLAKDLALGHLTCENFVPASASQGWHEQGAAPSPRCGVETAGAR